MAQINITLNQEEILQLMSNDREGAFKKLLADSLNSLLKAESANQLNAEPYERSDERTDSRNGFRDRNLNTRIGKIELNVPRHRKEPFKSMIFDNYTRSEAALISAMTEMVINGVSTRKVTKVVETLCGTNFSKSTVSELCGELDENVNQFKSRPLENNYPFIYLDATYFKVRENHRIISKAFMIAMGINERGHTEIIGFDTYQNESNDTWIDFLKKLKSRGLSGVKMYIADSHEGISNAASRVFPDVPWQKCQYHFVKNIIDKVPKKYQTGISFELREMFNSEDIKQARQRRDEIIRDYTEIAPEAVERLENGFDAAMSVMNLPFEMRVHLRTSNPLERVNRELKRRSKAIGIFPNSDSINRLMGSVLIEHHEQMIMKRALVTASSIRSLMENDDTQKKLIQLAIEQRNLSAA